MIFFLGVLNVAAQDLMPEAYRSLPTPDFARSFRYSPNAKFCAMTEGGSRIVLMNEQFSELWSSKGPAAFGGDVVFTADSKYMIFSPYMSEADIAVYSLEDKRVIQFSKSQKYYITALAVSPDGKLIVSGGDSRELKVYTMNGGRMKWQKSLSVDGPDYQYINVISFSPDGKLMAAAGTGTDIFIFSVADTSVTPLQQIPFKYWTSAMTFDASSKFLLTASSDSVYIWEHGAREVSLHRAFEYSGGETTCLRFDPSGKFLLLTKENGTIAIFNWEAGAVTEYNEISPHGPTTVFDVEFSPDGLFMVTCGADKQALIWKLGDITAWEQRVFGDQRGVVITTDADSVQFNVSDASRNFMLVIGVNDYTDWPKLNNAKSDAEAFKQVLNERYGFDPANTMELYDQQVTVKNILDRLSEIRDRVGADDNLVIYFSGHGFYDKAIDEGYWIPYNARKGEVTDYLPNSTLVKYIKAMNCKHIFLVVDACFSGALFSDGHKGYVEKVGQCRSRWCLSSGRLELVSDGKTGDHSPFAYYLLKFLNENTKDSFPVSELIQYVKVAVSNNTEQTPLGNPLKNVGDEGGEFIFRLKR